MKSTGQRRASAALFTASSTPAFGLILALVSIFASGAARAEVDSVVIARQYGLHYLPLVLMENLQLVEKNAAKAGIPLKADWKEFSGGASVNEALIAGAVNLTAGGVGPLITIWDKTRNNADVRGVAAISDIPMTLVTRNPAVKALEDFTDNDRIALPAVKVSMQAVTLEMAAAKLYGIKSYDKLDSLTVSMPHPDAAAALESAVAGVTAHFSAPPYTYSELNDPKIHKVTDSFQIYGGPATLIVLYTSNKFVTENPKAYGVILAALRESMDIINKDRRAAMKAYMAATKEKYDDKVVDEFVGDPQIAYKIAPHGVQATAEFMLETGRIKNKPSSWKDMFFSAIHDEPGS